MTQRFAFDLAADATMRTLRAITRTLLPIVPILAVMGCAAGDPTDDSGEAFVHDEPSDLEPVEDEGGKADGIAPSSFDKNTVVQEAFFTDYEAVDAAALQQFFENSPYKTRSFLADEMVGGKRVSEIIVETARTVGINPIVMIARMQVESGLVSKTVRPSSTALDHAFGCGCHDGSACMTAYTGFDKQIACATDVLSSLYSKSMDGTGVWQKGRAKKTLDPTTVTPSNHATAALYGYTPWVLVRRGGNWLVWNVTRRYAVHFDKLGLLKEEPVTPTNPWIGTPCEGDQDCAFSADGETGFCFNYETSAGTKGFCSLLCEGYCPDRSDAAKTFCTLTDETFLGNCVSRAVEENNNCSDIPGTSAQSVERYVGSSAAPLDWMSVCLP